MIGKNNPLNIRYSKKNNWKGQVGSTRGFCDFDSEYHGVRACFVLLIRSYYERVLRTYKDIIYTYAPPKENDSAKYLEYVTTFCCVYPWDKPVTFYDYCVLIEAMSKFEGNPVGLFVSNYIQFLKKEFENVCNSRIF